MGEHAGLARAGARDDEHRAVAVGDRVVLGAVEAIEQFGRHHGHPTGGH